MLDRLYAVLDTVHQRLHRLPSMASATSAPRAVQPPNAVDTFQHLDDEAWFEVLGKTLEEPFQQGIRFPGFPADATQQQFVGSAGRACLREGFNFYRLIKEQANAVGQPIHRRTKLLDFGCGWGRMLRCFLRDVDQNRLFGADVDPVIISFCHSAFDDVRFSVVPALPPSGYPESFFDIVYAYSVFSHLNEETHLRWVEELMRCLKPGGLLLATTQSRRFIDFCESLRKQENLETVWHRSLARCFTDLEQTYQAYDDGEFLHVATGGGDFRPPSFYGETMIPPRYVERVWTKFGHLVQFRDEASVLPQALIVMQR